MDGSYKVLASSITAIRSSHDLREGLCIWMYDVGEGERDVGVKGPARDDDRKIKASIRTIELRSQQRQ